MSRTDIWLDVKMRVRTNSELLEQKLRSLPKNANQVEWPFDRDLGDAMFTEEDKCKKDAFQGEKKSKNKEKKKNKNPSIVWSRRGVQLLWPWNEVSNIFI